jgi:aspartate--ammonia ligase
MDAIRKDEVLDNMHSIYVDQWDWEMCIGRADRNETMLRQIVDKIYGSIRSTEQWINDKYHRTTALLPQDIHSE